MSYNIILDMQTFKDAQEVMKGKFSLMIDYYFEDSETYINEILNAFNDNDVKRMIAPAHTLKSSSKQIGAIKISELAKEIELNSREFSGSSREFENIKKNILNLKDIFSETKEAIKAQI